MTVRNVPQFLALLIASVAVIGCSGGGGGGGDEPIAPPPADPVISLKALGGGIGADRVTSLEVTKGQSATIELVADPGFTLDDASVDSADCIGSYDGATDTYTIGEVTGDCTITATFEMNAGHELVTLGYDIKQLVFDLAEPVSGAVEYRLEEDFVGLTTGTYDFSQVLTATKLPIAYDIAVHNHDWPNASYRVLACDGSGTDATCVTHDPVSTYDAALGDYGNSVKPIGYVKAPLPEFVALFGTVVALSADGETLAVGAPGEGTDSSSDNGEGAVYVFVRDGVAGWVEQARLEDPTPALGDQFGKTLAFSADGNTLAIGAPYEDRTPSGGTNLITSAGAVYVFTREGGAWSETPVDVHTDAAEYVNSLWFGRTLDLSADGKTLAVAAANESVYMFEHGDSTGWVQKASISDSNSVNATGFGVSLALSDDGVFLAVGAPNHDSTATGVCDVNQTTDDCAAVETTTTAGITDVGAVFMFAREGDDWSTWDKHAFIKAPNAAVGHQFGYSVDMMFAEIRNSFDMYGLAVGVPYEDGAYDQGVCTITAQYDCSAEMSSGTLADAGAVYQLVGWWSGNPDLTSGWAFGAYIKADNPGTGDNFGWSVALNPGVTALVVGAPGEKGTGKGINPTHDSAATVISGAAYRFEGDVDGNWGVPVYIKAPNPDSGDLFARTLALSSDGRTLVVGAASEDSSGEDSGGNLVGICATVELACGGEGEAQVNDGYSSSGSGAVYLY